MQKNPSEDRQSFDQWKNRICLRVLVRCKCCSVNTKFQTQLYHNFPWIETKQTIYRCENAPRVSIALAKEVYWHIDCFSELEIFVKPLIFKLLLWECVLFSLPINYKVSYNRQVLMVSYLLYLPNVQLFFVKTTDINNLFS